MGRFEKAIAEAARECKVPKEDVELTYTGFTDGFEAKMARLIRFNRYRQNFIAGLRKTAAAAAGAACILMAVGVYFAVTSEIAPEYTPLYEPYTAYEAAEPPETAATICETFFFRDISFDTWEEAAEQINIKIWLPSRLPEVNEPYSEIRLRDVTVHEAGTMNDVPAGSGFSVTYRVSSEYRVPVHPGDTANRPVSWWVMYRQIQLDDPYMDMYLEHFEILETFDIHGIQVHEYYYSIEVFTGVMWTFEDNIFMVISNRRVTNVEMHLDIAESVIAQQINKEF
jgi:hypothetical protein